MKDFFTIGAAAEKLHVSREFLTGLIESGLLKAVQVNRRQFVTAAALATYQSRVAA